MSIVADILTARDAMFEANIREPYRFQIHVSRERELLLELSECCLYPSDEPLPEVPLQRGERLVGIVGGVFVTVLDPSAAVAQWLRFDRP
jgi:hypothetical protein